MLKDKNGKELTVGDWITDGNGIRVINRSDLGLFGLVECYDVIFYDAENFTGEINWHNASYLTEDEVKARFEYY